MTPHTFLFELRSGTYGDLDRLKISLNAFLQKYPDMPPAAIVRNVILSQRIDSLEYVLEKFHYTPVRDDISNAVRSESIDTMNIVCRHASQDLLDWSIQTSMIQTRGFLKVLLDNGADPNINDGRPMLAVAENGMFDALKLLHSRGGRLTPAVFDAACYWDHFEIAYWLYLRGARGYETPGFLAYKAEQDAIRNEAQRKIYFWILPKLYRNREFVMKQASKSYDALFGVSEA